MARKHGRAMRPGEHDEQRERMTKKNPWPEVYPARPDRFAVGDEISVVSEKYGQPYRVRGVIERINPPGSWGHNGSYIIRGKTGSRAVDVDNPTARKVDTGPLIAAGPIFDERRPTPRYARTLEPYTLASEKHQKGHHTGPCDKDCRAGRTTHPHRVPRTDRRDLKPSWFADSADEASSR